MLENKQQVVGVKNREYDLAEKERRRRYAKRWAYEIERVQLISWPRITDEPVSTSAFTVQITITPVSCVTQPINSTDGISRSDLIRGNWNLVKAIDLLSRQICAVLFDKKLPS